MKVPIKKVKKLLLAILVKNKVPQLEANILVETYLEGELQGKYSHGLMAFASLVKKLPYKKRTVRINKKSSSYIFVDARANFGAVVGRQLADQAMAMAKKQGVGLVLIKNMLSWLRPGTVAEYIAAHNMIALVTNNGGRLMMAPSGGYNPKIGTNPIGIGIPSSNGNIVIDMATSKRAWGEVRKALADNKTLPPETYLDKQGKFTINPQKAYSVVGAGDYKGFSLGLFIEILAGSLLGMPMGEKINITGDYYTKTRGAMILVINPSFSCGLARFKKENEELKSSIKKSKKIKKVKEIIIPGERAFKLKEYNIKNGYIEIKNKLWQELLKF